jgi:hypothetical protein
MAAFYSDTMLQTDESPTVEVNGHTVNAEDLLSLDEQTGGSGRTLQTDEIMFAGELLFVTRKDNRCCGKLIDVSENVVIFDGSFACDIIQNPIETAKEKVLPFDEYVEYKFGFDIVYSDKEMVRIEICERKSVRNLSQSDAVLIDSIAPFPKFSEKKIWIDLLDTR